MLRYIYFISLLFCISLSEEEFLRSGKKYRRSNRYDRGKINRKREDLQNFDDKESIAHIDLASFIQNPDDITLNNDNEQRQVAFNDYSDDSPIINAEFEKDRQQDYQGLESDIVPEKFLFNGKHVPQRLNINARAKQSNEYSYINNQLNNVNDDISFNTKFRHNAHAEKKCALKNMKIPFFSRDKISKPKPKKNKKRKLFGFRNSKKTTNITKLTDIYNSNNIKKVTKEPHTFKINKRSYYERLCPACKQKFISNSNLYLTEKCRAASNAIHNSRQYNQNRKYDEAESETIDDPNSFPEERENQNSDNFKNFKGDRRKRNNKMQKNKSVMKDKNDT